VLVLTRKQSEAILIKGEHEEIRITLVDIEKGKARIGIEAPKGYLILREELLDEARLENRRAVIQNMQAIDELKE